MCGIAGYCLSPQDHKTAEIHELASQLLLDIEHRGTHATGSAWIDRKSGGRIIRKAPLPATHYVRKAKDLCHRAQTAIMHTRYATQGTPKNNANNHPIPRGRIVLTHNGHIHNDRDLFRQLRINRIGAVDSEAVTALLAFGNDHPTQLLTEMEGTASLAWIEQDKPDILHLARVNSSPLWIGQTLAGSLVYGSTEETIENASIMLDSDLAWKHSALEGEYFMVKAGKIVEYDTFTPRRAHSVKHWWEFEGYTDDEQEQLAI
jgi:glucosamine 6-phosphate synthetase-like amidotransferase/phosphosugar isomerase protein